MRVGIDIPSHVVEEGDEDQDDDVEYDEEADRMLDRGYWAGTLDGEAVIWER